MKAIILYDLAAPVEMSPEDAEVVALVNRGHSAHLEEKVIIQDGAGLYLVKRPKSLAMRLRSIILALLAILGCLTAFGLILWGLMVMSLPFEFPSSLTLLTWSVFLIGLHICDRYKN